MRRFPHFSIRSAALVGCLVAASFAVAASTGASSAVATVNGVVIPQTDMEFIVKHQVLTHGGKDSPEVRSKVHDFLVLQQVLSQEAGKEGLDKSADFAIEERLGRADVLRNALFDTYVKAHPAKGANAQEKSAATQKAIEAYVTTLKAKAKVTDQANAVANVDGTVIAKADADFIARHEVERGGKDTPELRAKLRDFLVVQQILSQEAVRQGLDKGADFQTALRFSRADTLRTELFSHYMAANPITDAMMKAEYDKRIASMTPAKEYHAHHILLKTEADANAVLAALKGGQSFEALAKAKSTDDGSKASGGDLGWVQPERFVPEFSSAMVKLKKGETTQAPVKSQYGYHVIKLDDVRQAPNPTFDQVKGQMKQFMQREQIDKFVNELKSKAVIS